MCFVPRSGWLDVERSNTSGSNFHLHCEYRFVSYEDLPGKGQFFEFKINTRNLSKTAAFNLQEGSSRWVGLSGEFLMSSYLVTGAYWQRSISLVAPLCSPGNVSLKTLDLKKHFRRKDCSCRTQHKYWLKGFCTSGSWTKLIYNFFFNFHSISNPFFCLRRKELILEFWFMSRRFVKVSQTNHV